ncbi:MAG TPA: hypothetical protein VFG54_00900 [Prolixibacteraceae bacterium]|nr:hypothetical protein [Prolixibacteraceae bacterium]
MKRTDFLCLLFILAMFLQGCSGTKLIRSFASNQSIKNPEKHTKYLKLHLKDGGLYVLNSWVVSHTSDTIFGFGSLYNYKRQKIRIIQAEPSPKVSQTDRFSIAKEDIILAETNMLEKYNANIAAISVIGVPMALVTVYCITNPKACFGSCPTFYAMENNQWTMMAEGFSSSISPSFEKKDIDMLYWADEPNGEVTLKLTNEALETHVIRYVDLLLFPKSPGELVFSTEEEQFFRTSNIKNPISCKAEEGDCLDLVKEMDRQERFSAADSKNLAQKEEILFSFNNDPFARQGLLIGSKQTLLTTHLFYNVMAYTGTYYGTLVAEVENGNTHAKSRIQKLWDKLGGIEIYLQKEDKKWVKIDEINEMGPIASDVHLVKLPAVKQDKMNMKLRLTKGLWRIDYLALAAITGEESPLRIQPSLVLNNDSTDQKAFSQLTGQKEPLVTMPGDQYTLHYKIPEDCTYQYFLESKGYYLEWMREGWLEEEDLKKAAFAFYFPGRFMRKAAPEYKKVEPLMEKIFWESRYVRK